MTWRETEAGYWEAQDGARWMSVLRLQSGRHAYFTGGHGSGTCDTLAEAEAACEATVGLERPRPVVLPAGMSSGLAHGSGGYVERLRRGEVDLGPLFPKRGAA